MKTVYGYTNEYSGDSTQLTYLRARFYASVMGWFLTRDTWGGNFNNPLSLNRWMYGYGNPVNLTDPTGHFPAECLEADNFADCLREWRAENCPDYYDAILNLPEVIQRERIKSFGIILEPEEKWTGAWLTNLTKVLFQDIGVVSLPRWMNHKSTTLTIDKEGSAICLKNQQGCYHGNTGLGITFQHTNAINDEINMLHEFGHLVDNLSDSSNDFTNQLYDRTFSFEGKFWAGWNGSTYASIPSSGKNNVY